MHTTHTRLLELLSQITFYPVAAHAIVFMYREYLEPHISKNIVTKCMPGTPAYVYKVFLSGLKYSEFIYISVLCAYPKKKKKLYHHLAHQYVCVWIVLVLYILFVYILYVCCIHTY